MASIHSACILALAFISATNARRAPPHLEHERRQLTPVAVSASTTALPLTTIFPSPGASPVVVTSQSQIVSTFIPQFTLCELPPLAFLTPSALATSTGSLPFLNYSISTPSGNGTCTTIYKPTITAVCATVLSDLTTTYTISQCNQNITFSTEYGYSLVIPTPTPVVQSGINSTSYITPPPSIQTMRTYYVAPWQDLTSAGPPADVDYKICKEYENGTEACILEYYRWRTTLLTLSSLTTTLINLTTTIPGPSQLIIETLVANVTGTAITFSMSTTMELETSTLVESTVATPKYQLTAPAVYQTKTVEYASPLTTTITSHVKLTLTTTVGTATVTLTRSTPSAGVASALPQTVSITTDDIPTATIPPNVDVVPMSEMPPDGN